MSNKAYDCETLYHLVVLDLRHLDCYCNNTGNDRVPRGPHAGRGGGPQKAMNIEVPSFPLSELNRFTNNFSDNALIGEGSYGRVYRATLSSEETAALKKLDPSVCQDPESDFVSQVNSTLQMCFTISI